MVALSPVAPTLPIEPRHGLPAEDDDAGKYDVSVGGSSSRCWAGVLDPSQFAGLDYEYKLQMQVSSYADGMGCACAQHGDCRLGPHDAWCGLCCIY